MEGERRRGAALGHALQKTRGFLGRRAELAGQLEHRAAQGRRDAHEDAQLLGVARFGQQLVELEIAIDDVVGDAVLLEGGLGRAGQAHRRHEMAMGVGKARA